MNIYVTFSVDDVGLDNDFLKKIFSKVSKKQTVSLLGDFNVNLLNYHTHTSLLDSLLLLFIPNNFFLIWISFQGHLKF